MSTSHHIAPSDKLSLVKTYYFARKLKEIAELNSAGHDIINLGIGSPDLAPPNIVPLTLTQSLSLPKANQYQSYYGLPQLREAFSDFYGKHFDTSLNPANEILPLIGSKEGIMHIAMSFLDPGDEVLIPNPGYPAYKMTTLLAGGVPKFFSLTSESHWMPDFETIEKEDLTNVKLMWVNYPNMPTGQKGNKELFRKLIAFGLKHNILICHDNPYAFILNEEPLSILSLPDAKKTAIELTSLSKCFNMAGWRVGAVLGSSEYLNHIIKFKSNMDSGMFMPMQLAAAAALRVEPEWFINLNEVYNTRRTVVWKIYDALGIGYSKEGAGLFVWGKVPTGLGETWSDKLLGQAKVFITPGFIFGDNGSEYIRISLCSPVEKLEEAYGRIISVKQNII